MKELAKMIGDLHYETLAEFLSHLTDKIYGDGTKDRMAGRNKLGYELQAASSHLSLARKFIEEAWLISKPFMTADEK